MIFRSGYGQKILLLGAAWFVSLAVSQERPSAEPLRPLTEFAATDRYLGFDGGLYGAGQNEPSPEWSEIARRELVQIVPRDSLGNPSTDGRIGFIAMSMSNAEQEFGAFRRMAESAAESRKSPQVVLVNTAQGGRAMSAWAMPRYRTFEIAEERIRSAGLSPQQVQVAWVKLAIELLDGRPIGSPNPSDLTANLQRVRADTRVVLREAKRRFSNLRIVYLGSRTFGGYATTDLNPEPYAYQSAFAVRSLILDQQRGDPGLAFDAARGAAPVPLLMWGPYLWARGDVPRREDGFSWERADFGRDGTHPSRSGEEKVARLMLHFFQTHPLASGWFTRSAR